VQLKTDCPFDSKSTFRLLFDWRDQMDVASLKMIIEWPNGTRLPVRLASDATGADLIALLQFATTAHSPVFLINDGHFLHPRRQLRRQKIHENSVIRVVNFEATSFNFFDDEPPKSRDESMDQIFAEILRITDMQYHQLESHRKAIAYYQSILADSARPEVEPSQRPSTVLPPAPARMSDEALPFWKSSSDDDDLKEWRW
jgi:hypothetical protein